MNPHPLNDKNTGDGELDEFGSDYMKIAQEDVPKYHAKVQKFLKTSKQNLSEEE